MSNIQNINTQTLRSYMSNFTNEKAKFTSSAYNTFQNSYLSTCSNYEVNRMYNKLKEKYQNIEKYYNSIEKYLNDYVTNVEGIENSLTNNGGSITESSIRSSINGLPELKDYQNNLHHLVVPNANVIKGFVAGANASLNKKNLNFNTLVGGEVINVVKVAQSIFNKQNPGSSINLSNYTGDSIVEALKLNNYESSFDFRAKLAADFGIENYQGTVEQNLELLNILKNNTGKDSNDSYLQLQTGIDNATNLANQMIENLKKGSTSTNKLMTQMAILAGIREVSNIAKSIQTKDTAALKSQLQVGVDNASKLANLTIEELQKNSINTNKLMTQMMIQAGFKNVSDITKSIQTKDPNTLDPQLQAGIDDVSKLAKSMTMLLKAQHAVNSALVDYNVDFVKRLANTDLDEEDFFGKGGNTIVGDGERVRYTRKVKNKDGSIEYYCGNTLIKLINPDGSVKFNVCVYNSSSVKGDPRDMPYFSCVLDVDYAYGDWSEDFFNGSICFNADGSIEIKYDSGIPVPGGEPVRKQVINNDGSYEAFGTNGNLIQSRDKNGIIKQYMFIEKNNNSVLGAISYPDGSYSEFDYYYENDQLKNRKNSDGSYEEYYENGQLKNKKNADGSSESYYENGQITGKQISDGSYEEYYENGQITGKQISDGSYEEYYENGQLKKKTNADGSYKTYDLNGKVLNIVNADGSYTQQAITTSHGCSITRSDGSSESYYANGQLENKKNADGSSESYYENGQLEYKKNVDGSNESYYESGQLKQKTNADGSYKTYDLNGKVLDIINADGSYTQRTIEDSNGSYIKEFKDGSYEKYYETGQLECKSYSDGSGESYYANGQLWCKINSDGSYIKYDENGNIIESYANGHIIDSSGY